MKKINLSVTILIALLFFSCSSDDDSPHLSQSELLVENSPWIFDHYELIEILDAGDSDISQQFIVEDMNIYAAGMTISFNKNGTLGGQANQGTRWEITDTDQLKIIYPNEDVNIFNKITVTGSELRLEAEAVTYDENIQFEVLHYGILVFK